MATFRQHIPAFVETGGPPPATEFANTEELLALEVVQRYGKSKDFSHFAMSDRHLIEVRDDGFHWWVVGSVSDPAIVDLPQWEGWKFRAELADGTRAIIGNEVVSSCGDVLTLRDGTKARNLRA
jgi:hypothetical protein